MLNELQRLLSYSRKLWRRRWLVLGVAIAVCAIGWPIVYALPDKYEVTAKVYLDTQSILKPLLEGIAIENSTMTQTTMVIRRTLLSRTNMEKVVYETGMDQKARNPEEFERILKKLAEKIVIYNDGPEQIYSISYVDRDPKLAKHVVEKLLNIFVEGALNETRQDTTSTQKFLNEQISDYEFKLEAAENALKKFKRKNVGLMPEVGQTYFSQLSTAMDRLNVAQLEFKEAINRRNELKQQIKRIKVPDDIPGGPAISPLQEKLNKLLLKYTEHHPEVIAMRRLMADQEGQNQSHSYGSVSPNQPPVLLRQNLAYQELKVAEGKAEAEVAALRVRVKQHEARVAHLRKMVDTMPQVEAELTKLNRDYSIIKDNYEELVRRREAAKITYEAEISTDDVQFKVIEPPRVPLLPVSPRRLLLFTGTLVLGIGAGLSLALLLIQIRPTFDSWQELNNVTSLPVFGVISMVSDPSQRVKEFLQSVSFWSVFTIFIIVFSIIASMRIFRLDHMDLINVIKEFSLL